MRPRSLKKYVREVKVSTSKISGDKAFRIVDRLGTGFSVAGCVYRDSTSATFASGMSPSSSAPRLPTRRRQGDEPALKGVKTVNVDAGSEMEHINNMAKTV
mmetsp:Transcript_5210/g.11025  ORF Transcript_5210/g.11025 Transcript_5210/m.11025 type:complete len:101 (+) Transcript_5210:1023-1325(+)